MTNPLYDLSDDRVKALIVARARSEYESEFLSLPIERLAFHEHTGPWGEKQVIVYDVQQRDPYYDTIELKGSIKQIVADAILDLLTK